jgi:hypothetical protein
MNAKNPTPKQRATSAPRVSAPASATPPAKATRSTTAAKTAAPVAPRSRFAPLQCHWRDADGVASCKEKRDPTKPRRLLCAKHEYEYHHGGFRLSATGTVRMLARLEAAKLDPTVAAKGTKAPAKKAPAPRSTASKARPRPAQVAKIPPQNVAPALPPAELHVVSVKGEGA